MIVQVRAVNELWQVRNYQMSRTSEYDRCILSCRPSFLTVGVFKLLLYTVGRHSGRWLLPYGRFPIHLH